MQRLYSMFPPGSPGIGLVFLRIVVALSLHVDLSGHLIQVSGGVRFAALLALSMLVAVGLFTPIAALLCVTLQTALLLSVGGAFPSALIARALEALALLLLGPGAYSLDARLFGRRVLILHSSDE